MSEQQEFVIIIVDDEPSSRLRMEHEICSTFQNLITIVSCPSADVALASIKSSLERKAHVPLVISDFDMPEKNGLSFLRELRAELPFLNSTCLLVVASHEEDAARQAKEEHLVSATLSKPWVASEFYQSLKDILSRYILRFAYDQLPYYETIVSHRHYRLALQESERHRVELKEEIGRFARNLLDTRTTSDEDLRESLAGRLAKLVPKEEKQRVFRHYQPGDTILRQGSVNSQIFLVLQGEVKHLAADQNQELREVFQESAGAIIGSMSFFTAKPTATCVVALSEVRALALDQSILDQAMSSDVQFLISFSNLLLRQVLSRVRKNIEINVKLQDALDELRLAQLHLIESEKMATLGQLVAGVAHELNNPAAAIVRSVDHLAKFLKSVLTEAPHARLQEQAIHSFDLGSQLIPMSTREIRQRSQNLQHLLKSSLLAKQAVELGFNDPEQLQALAQLTQWPEIKLVDYLHHYYEIGRFLRNIASSGSRIEALVSSLKSYARQDKGEFEIFDVHQGIEETLLILQHRLKHFELIKDYGDLPLIYGLPAALNQVWTNLISNALDAMGQNGKLTIKTTFDTERQQVQFHFRDNGPGIPLELRHKIFALNFTTKRGTGFGLGIGLAICKNIVDKHHGRIEIDSIPGEYAEFIVILPITQQSTE
ncbi:MAG: ATP-binding protein [Oligoflexus sp.]